MKRLGFTLVPGSAFAQGARPGFAARRPLGFTLVLLALALTACPTPKPIEPDGGTKAECETRADCSTGKICTEQKFCSECESSGQCRTREVCDAMTRLCRLRDGWGEACGNNEQCQAGSWCKQGLCVDRAEVSLCSGGMSSECPMGLRCNSVTTVCEEDLGCSDNADCSMGEVCNTGSHACVPRCTAETQADVCLAGERCVKEKCVQCELPTDCGPGLTCDLAGKCSSGERCYADRDCKVPLICFEQTGACLEKPPPCVNDDYCTIDQRCDVGSGKCVPRACQPDRYEPNNMLSSAYAVTAGRYNDLTLCPMDVDHFTLNLGRGDQLGINIDADPFSENNFSAVVKDDSGRTLASGKLLVSYVATASQKYFVAISTIDPFQPYDVTFLLSRGTPCDDDALEPNDQAAQPTPINNAPTLEGAICPQDEDWFRALVPAGKALKVSLTNYDSSKGLLRLCVFEGATQLQCDDATLPVVSVPAATAGGKTLLVRVNGTTERAANGYTLKVELP